MRNAYPLIILLLCFFYFNSGAQSGSVCTNPYNIQLCRSTSSASNVLSFNNDTATWKTSTGQIKTKGPKIFYSITLPCSSYQPVSISATLAGYFAACPCSNTIYFLWFNKSPCNNKNPVAVDSSVITGIPSINDSLYVTYPVTAVQTTYYLVITFKNSFNNYYPYNYNYRINFGFANNQPPAVPVCSAAPQPYKGKLELDESVCYSAAHPYLLPIKKLDDDPSLQNVLVPSSLNQQLDSLPISDSLGQGFVLTLKRTDQANQEVYTSYDRFPYQYNLDNSKSSVKNNYDVAITAFFKNKTGISGLKGFRMRIPGSTNTFFPIYPDSAFYNKKGKWTNYYNPATFTTTWLFNDSSGRGDITDTAAYSCKVYSFTVPISNLTDTIEAWYLPDYYGHDSIECLPGVSNPPRTDCGLADPNYGDGWIKIIGNGTGGYFSGIGFTCGSDTSCFAGEHFNDGYTYGSGCNDYYPGGNSKCNFTDDVPHIKYDDGGCAMEVDPTWDEQNPMLEFANSGNVYGGICNGRPFPVAMICTGHYDYYNTPCFLVFQNTNGQLNPVDTAGNINYNVDLNTFSLTNLTVGSIWPYPVTAESFTIPISVPGYYSLFYTYANQVSQGLIYYYRTNCGVPQLEVVNDTIPIVTFSPASDTTVCAGNYYDITEDSQYDFSWDNSVTYMWSPDSSSYSGYYYDFAEVHPVVNTTYTVIATDFYGCADTVNYLVNVYLCPPIAEIGYVYDCTNPCNTFLDESPQLPAYWQWTFPGGTPSSYTGKNPPQVCYPAAGLYPVKLVVANNAGKDSTTQYVQVGTCLPLTYFTASDTILCNAGCVTFTNQSPFYNNNTSWSFPGGTPSSSTEYYSVQVCYPDTGTYYATLTAENSNGQSSSVVTIHVNDCNPRAGFTSADTICNSKCITYTDASAHSPATWVWSFEGGTPSSFNGQNPPQVCYNMNGTYQTLLTVTNSYGTDFIGKNITVQDCPAPTASFTVADTICATDCIPVTNTSSSNTTLWQWTFDGGSPSVYSGQTPPAVCYGTPGNYTIKLVAENKYGSDSTTATIVVNNCNPAAGFTTDAPVCASQCVTVTNNSSANSTSWQWSFVGGTPSSYNGQSPPPVCYSVRGVYTAELIAGNSYGYDTALKQIAVLDCYPHAFFSADDSVCRTTCTGYIDSSVNADGWQWIFMGGKPSSFTGQYPPVVCYDTTGIYTVQLIVSNTYGTDTAVQTVTVSDCSPHGSFSLPDTICSSDCAAPTNLSFTNAATWKWSFPGGNPSSFNGAAPPAVCYDSAGSYRAELITGNVYGADTFSKKITVQNCAPHGSFALHDTICKTQCIIIPGMVSINATSCLR